MAGVRVMVTLPGPDTAAGTRSPVARHVVVRAPDGATVGHLLAHLGIHLRGPDPARVCRGQLAHVSRRPGCCRSTTPPTSPWPG